MARRCDICGKGTTTGHNVPRKGQPKKQGGAGQHIGVRTLRKFKANIVSVKRKDLAEAVPVDGDDAGERNPLAGRGGVH